MPRSASKSSTSRKLKGEPDIKPDRLLDDFGREAVAAIADLGHHRWLRLKSLNGKPTNNVTRPARLPALMSSHPACSFALGSACAQSGDAAAQCSDQRRAVRKVLLLRIQNLHEAALLQRQNRIPFAIHIELRRIANDVDQPVQCVNTSQEVIVLAIGARKKRREMRKTNAFETAATTELLECIGILRANAIDQNLIELANFTPSHDRECQNVPKWKSEVVDQNVTTRVRMPLFGINGCQQHIDVGSAGIEIDLRRQPIHQKVDALQVKSHELAGILFEVLGISGRGREQALDQIAKSRL